jgi:hypothetical protein
MGHDSAMLAHLVRYPHLDFTAKELSRVLGWPLSGDRAKNSLARLEERGLARRQVKQGGQPVTLWRLAPLPLDISQENKTPGGMMPARALYTDEEIARIVHGAIQGLQYVLGEPNPAPPWDTVTPEMHESVILGVRRIKDGASPRDNHEGWLRFKQDHGWAYGPVKDEVIKTHPCMLAWEELPLRQQHKDELFALIVRFLGSQLTYDPQDGASA